MMSASTEDEVRHDRHRRLSTPWACGYRDAYIGRPAAASPEADYTAGYAEGVADRLRQAEARTNG